MRIQEHIYQGFFGLKKKKDASKYYIERVDKLRGLDSDIDQIIDAFQSIMNNHNLKIKKYDEYLKKPNSDSIRAVRFEIEKLEGMFDADDVSNDKEEKYVLKNITKLQELFTNEESSELKQLEHESLDDLKELLSLLRAIEPVWQRQIDFMKQHSDSEIITNSNSLRLLTDILVEESKILKLEESLLRKIDLKTGTILRKTSLKNSDINRINNKDMRYREVKYVR